MSVSPARITCDQCGAEVVAKKATNWLHLTRPPMSTPIFGSKPGQLRDDFCTYMRAALRTAAGLSQRQLAAALNVSPGAVKRWENTGSLPGIGVCRRYADALGWNQ